MISGASIYGSLHLECLLIETMIFLVFFILIASCQMMMKIKEVKFLRESDRERETESDRERESE